MGVVVMVVYLSPLLASLFAFCVFVVTRGVLFSISAAQLSLVRKTTQQQIAHSLTPALPSSSENSMWRSWTSLSGLHAYGHLVDPLGW